MNVLFATPAGIPWLERIDHIEYDPPPLRQFIAHEFPLGWDSVGRCERARLVVPEDMTAAEAERICRFVRSAAFPAQPPD